MIQSLYRQFSYYYKFSGLHAIVMAFHNLIVSGWANSFFGTLFTTDRLDEKSQNSVTYKVLTLPMRMLSGFASRTTGRFAETVRSSFVFSILKEYAVNILTINCTFIGALMLSVMIFGIALDFKPGALLYIRIFVAVFGLILMFVKIPLIKKLSGSLLFSLAEKALGAKIEISVLEKLETKRNPLALGVVCGIGVAVLGYLMNFNILAYAAFIGLIGVLIIMWRFEAGVFILAFTAPFLPTMACAGLSLLCLVSYIFRCIAEKRPFIRVDAISLMIIGFLVLFALYSATSLSVKKSSEIYLIYFAFISAYFLVVNIATNKTRLYWLGSIFVTAGLLVSFYGIYQQFFGKGLDNVWVDQEMFEDISVRVYSTLENPNVLGEYLLLVIPIAMAMIWACKGFLAKLYYSGVFAASSLCLIYTQSRGCWVAIMVGFLIYILFINKKYMSIFFLALLAAPFILPSSILERFFSIGNVQDTSTSYRLSIWLGSMAMLADFWPYGIGIGELAFNRVYSFYSHSMIYAPHTHNIYLQILAETGIVGLALLITCFILFWRRLANLVGAAGKTTATVMGIAVLAATVSFMLQGAFDYVWYNYRVFLMFWIVVAMGTASRNIAMKEMQT